MISIQTKIFRDLLLVLALTALGGLMRTQSSVSPAAAQEPGVNEPTLSILIVPEGETFSIAGVDTVPTFKVGDTFKVSIAALGVAQPGIYGGQFEVTYNTNHLEAVEGTLIPGAALEPVVVAVSSINNIDGLAAYAASRQGDLDNVSGNVELATLRFEAVGPTEPPEGQTTVIHLQNVKLGAKGGLEVPVAGLVDLEVIIKPDDTPADGDIVGNIKVEGRADNNQAGHEVVDDTILSTLTDAFGDFVFASVEFGTYNFVADSPGFLAAACDGVVHDVGPMVLNEVVLLAGDINDDDVIDVTDAVAIASVFGSTEPEVADLNLDGRVDVLDLILMAVNFEESSAANPWVCQ